MPFTIVSPALPPLPSPPHLAGSNHADIGEDPLLPPPPILAGPLTEEEDDDDDLNNRYMRDGSSQTNSLSAAGCSFPETSGVSERLLGKIESAHRFRIPVANAGTRAVSME